jgi:hypothetical protein
MAYHEFMEFIESHIFEKQVNALLSDDEFALFQGKSGGVRVIYFYVTAAAKIRLIAIYKEGIKDDLNAAEKKTLKKLNENW